MTANLNPFFPQFVNEDTPGFPAKHPIDGVHLALKKLKAALALLTHLALPLPLLSSNGAVEHLGDFLCGTDENTVKVKDLIPARLPVLIGLLLVWADKALVQELVLCRRAVLHHPCEIFCYFSLLFEYCDGVWQLSLLPERDSHLRVDFGCDLGLPTPASPLCSERHRAQLPAALHPGRTLEVPVAKGLAQLWRQFDFCVVY